jgi:hypothetical protein
VSLNNLIFTNGAEKKFYFENKDTKNSNSMDDGKKSDEMKF